MSDTSIDVISRLLEDPRIEQVWRKGAVTVFGDPALIRVDEYGNIIQRDKYGDRTSLFGWEIDHIIPRARGGSDDLSNLRPLQCRANASLGGIMAAE